jgi:hypothetical protein
MRRLINEKLFTGKTIGKSNDDSSTKLAWRVLKIWCLVADGLKMQVGLKSIL